MKRKIEDEYEPPAKAQKTFKYSNFELLPVDTLNVIIGFLSEDSICRLIFTSHELMGIVGEYLTMDDAMLIDVISHAMYDRYVSIIDFCVPICEQQRISIEKLRFAADNFINYRIRTSVNSKLPVSIGYCFRYDFKVISSLINSGIYKVDLKTLNIFIHHLNHHSHIYPMEDYRRPVNLMLSAISVEMEHNDNYFDLMDSLKECIHTGDLEVIKKIIHIGKFAHENIYEAYREAIAIRQERVAGFINGLPSSWIGHYIKCGGTQRKITDYFSPALDEEVPKTKYCLLL